MLVGILALIPSSFIYIHKMASTIKTSSDLYHQILDLKSLQPGPEVNEVFTQLVKLCLTSKVVDLVKQVSRCDADFKVNDLVCKCLQAEELMEKVWAKRIASGEAKVSDFWYYQNYGELLIFCLYLKDLRSHLVDITAYETQALISSRFDFAQKQEKSCEVVFIGSGSLPLTAFLLAQSFPNIRVTLIDREAEAHQLARAWMEVADGEAASRIRLVETDFFDCQPNDFKAFDVVYLAVSLCLPSPYSTHSISRPVLVAMNNARHKSLRT